MTSTTFSFTGASQPYTVPAGVSLLICECWGASGSNQKAGGGGLGGYAKTLLPVTPGETLLVYVGGMSPGYGSGGWNGGGVGGFANGNPGSAGGGGGGTDIRQGGAALTNRVLVAGGGGGPNYTGSPIGAGDSDGGGAYGTSAIGALSAGSPGDAQAGAGSQVQGGVGATSTLGTHSVGGTGDLGQGGSGATSGAAGYEGGGGGGGYYGGGGAGDGYGTGGGGSGYVPASDPYAEMQVGVWAGNGKAVITLPPPPNPPSLLNPPNNQPVSDAATQRFTWQFQPGYSGDVQTGYDLRYSSDGGTTWTTLNGSTANQYADVGPLTDGSYQWQVRTYGKLGQAGAWSSSSFFTVAAPPAPPTVTDPASGSTIGTATAPVTWTASVQQAYQVRRVADNAGTADTSRIYYDTGQVTDTTTRSVTVPFETNDRTEHVQVRIEASGLWSDWADATVTVSYTPPPTPEPTITADPAAGTITITWTTPAPGADQPAAASTDLYVQGGPEGTVRLAAAQPTNGTFVWRLPGSGATYSFQVIATGTNSVTAASAWT